MNYLRSSSNHLRHASYLNQPHSHILKRTFSMASIESTMDTVVCHGIGDYRYEKQASPTEVKPGEVLIEVTRVGICAGDTKCYLGADLFFGPDAYGQTYCQPPVTPGHEFVGNVIALGDGASQKYNLQIGDQAIAEQIVPCNECEMCIAGDYNMCNPWNHDRGVREAHAIYGFRQSCQGAMANYMKYVQNSRIHKISKKVPPKHAVFLEPLTCGIHAVNRANIKETDVVVISGAGAVGCGAICAAKMKNPKCIVVLDPLPFKLETAKACGADYAWNPMEVDVVKNVMEMTDFYGCHKYLEITGAPASVRQGLDMLRRKGTFVEYSVFKEDVLLNMTKVSDEKELDILGGHLGPGCYPQGVHMLENGLVPIEMIIRDETTYNMYDFMKGFSTVDRAITPPVGFTPPEESIKVTLDPFNSL